MYLKLMQLFVDGETRTVLPQASKRLKLQVRPPACEAAVYSLGTAGELRWYQFSVPDPRLPLCSRVALYS